MRIFKIAIIFMLLLSGCAFGRGTLKDDDFIVVEGDSELRLAAYGYETLNPSDTKSESMAAVYRLVFEPLYENDEKQTPTGVLAERSTVTSDGMNVTVDLADGVRFSDGTQLTSADVVSSFYAAKNGVYSESLAKITACQQAGSSVIFTMSEPVINVRSLLCFPVVKQAEIPLGTGVYSIEEVKTSELLLEPNIYHKESEARFGVRVKLFKNSYAIQNAFDAGELDSMAFFTDDEGEYSPKSGIQTKYTTVNRIVFMGYNTKNGRLANSALRAAIADCVDKTALLESVAYGKGKVSDYPFNPTAWYYEPRKSSFNLSDAMSALGYSKDDDGRYTNADGEAFSVSLAVNIENQERINLAQQIAVQLGKAGIAVDVFPLEYKEYIKCVKGCYYDCFIGEMLLGENCDPAPLLSGNNPSSFYSEEINNAIYAISMAADSDEEKLRYDEFMRIFDENPPILPLYFRNEPTYYAARVSGLFEPLIENRYRNAEQWYFYDN